MTEENISINFTDDLLHIPRDDDPLSKLGEFKPTNMPLSESQIELYEGKDAKHEGWGPRTTKNIADIVPLLERPNHK